MTNFRRLNALVILFALLASIIIVVVSRTGSNSIWLRNGISDHVISEGFGRRELETSSSEAVAGQSTIEDATAATAAKLGGINTFTNFLAPSDAAEYGLNRIDNGLFLPDAIRVRMIAVSGHKVPYANGSNSNKPFHARPDGAQVFADTRQHNQGGWIYVSNSEVENRRGGVGAITFDAHGNILDYKMVLTGTTMNCNGGRTHFGGWVSCEEDFFSEDGKAFLVDPAGIREPKPITMSLDGGAFEAFAYDIRNQHLPRFFLTEDLPNGPLRRWTPSNPHVADPWELLLGPGFTDYLLLSPSAANPNTGSYTWTRNINAARTNAKDNYPQSEGMDVSGNTLFFVSKALHALFELNLDTGEYTRFSTRAGVFDGQPDTIHNLLDDAETAGSEGILLFTEDGGTRAGIHARDKAGKLFTLLESSLFQPETTGLAVTPDGKRIYFCFQIDGIVFELSRRDNQSFRGMTMNLKSHPSEMTNEIRRRERRQYF